MKYYNSHYKYLYGIFIEIMMSQAPLLIRIKKLKLNHHKKYYENYMANNDL